MSASDESLWPELAVLCEGCGEDVRVPPELNPIEAAWMHEHECSAYLADVA